MKYHLCTQKPCPVQDAEVVYRIENGFLPSLLPDISLYIDSKDLEKLKKLTQESDDGVITTK